MRLDVPEHIAIIMDGNGRWARERGKTRLEGHAAGAAIIEDVVRACKDRGVKYLTIYAFSAENWGRPGDEVKTLMKLLGAYLIDKRQGMIDDGVRFNMIGDSSSLPSHLRDEIGNTIRATGGCGDIVLTVALSYGSRQEICRAVNRCVAKGVKDISVDDISRELDTAGMPDPDLLIRTGGEYRVSNYLLWQAAYCELYFTPVYWPDFDEGELDKAIAEYSRRERRYGLTSDQIES